MSWLWGSNKRYEPLPAQDCASNNAHVIKNLTNRRNNGALLQTGMFGKTDAQEYIEWILRSALCDLYCEGSTLHPYAIAHAYLQRLAETQIPVRNQNSTIQLDNNTGEFGFILLDKDIEEIETKLRNTNDRRKLEGVPFVAAKNCKKSDIERMEKIGAVLVGTETIVKPPTNADERYFQAAACGAALVANCCVGFAIHDACDLDARERARYHELWTCLTRHNDILITARNLRDLKLITLNYQGFTDNPLRENLTPKYPVVVCLGYNRNYEEDLKLYQISLRLESTNIGINYLFRTKKLRSKEDIRDIMTDTTTYAAEQNKIKKADEYFVNSFEFRFRSRTFVWSYSLTSLHNVEVPSVIDKGIEKSFHSISMPFRQQYIQITRHISEGSTCIELFHFAFKIALLRERW